MNASIRRRRDRAGHSLRRAAAGPALLVLVLAPADADWTVAAYLGAGFTQPAALELTQGPASIEMRDVHFDGRPFASPPYYGYRAGFRRRGRVGIEAELVHLKIYAHRGDLPDAVERFSISHGLNLLLGNVTCRVTERRRLHVDLRAGAGAAIPHGESEINGVAQEQYEVSSLAVQAAAGLGLRLSRHLDAFGEYKLTTAAPAVSVSGGHVRGRYSTQHAVAGVSWTFRKTARDASVQQR